MFICLNCFLLFSRGDRIEQVVLECLEGLILTGFKSSSGLFKWPKNWRAPRPPSFHALFFPKPTNQNFEIAILFSIVKNIITMSLGLTYSPTVLRGEAASYKFCSTFTYSDDYLEVYRPFQDDILVEGQGGLRGGDTWVDLTLEEFVMGEEKFYEGGAGFSSII